VLSSVSPIPTTAASGVSTTVDQRSLGSASRASNTSTTTNTSAAATTTQPAVVKRVQPKSDVMLQDEAPAFGASFGTGTGCPRWSSTAWVTQEHYHETMSTISGAPSYSTRSLEQLRSEDYHFGNGAVLVRLHKGARVFVTADEVPGTVVGVDGDWVIVEYDTDLQLHVVDTASLLI